MIKRDSFLDLEDWGTGPFCGRLRIFVEIESPSDYFVDLVNPKTGALVPEKDLSARDQEAVQKWVASEIETLCTRD